MEVAVTVGCPAVGKVDVAVVAYMQDCAPVIDWVAEPWRAGEVAPRRSGSLSKSIRKRYCIGGLPLCSEIRRPSVVYKWIGGVEVSVGAIWLQELVGALVSAINLDTRTLTRSPDSEVRTAFK